MNLAFSSSILDLRYQNRSNQYFMSNSAISASLYHSQQYQSVKEKLPNHYIYLFPSRKFIQQKSSAVCSWTKYEHSFVSSPFLLQPKLYFSFHGRLFYIAILSIVLKFKNTENNTNTIMSFKHDEFDCVLSEIALVHWSHQMPLLVQKSTGACDILH